MLQYKDILVPIDFSDISRAAIRKAVSMQDINQGKLTLIHIIDYVPPPYAAVDTPAIYASEELMVERAQSHLEALASELNVGDCTQIVRPGKTKKLLVEYVAENPVDLVVMGAHGGTLVDKIIGSTTSKIIQNVSCDVLVIHA